MRMVVITTDFGDFYKAFVRISNQVLLRIIETERAREHFGRNTNVGFETSL